jgi:hypothetical protein
MRPNSKDASALERGARVRQALALALVAGHLVGCGSSDGLTRVIVKGDVRLNGSPVEKGQIRFIPQVGSKGPVYLQDILDGKYVCDRAGGVPVGQHRIEILAWDPSVPFPKGPGAPTPKQLAPEKYNVKSELTITLDDATNPVVKDFDL